MNWPGRISLDSSAGFQSSAISLRQGFGPTSRRVNRALRGRGWTVIRIWEHELKRRDETKLVRRLNKQL
jgi:hypothetical protein